MSTAGPGDCFIASDLHFCLQLTEVEPKLLLSQIKGLADSILHPIILSINGLIGKSEVTRFPPPRERVCGEDPTVRHMWLSHCHAL